MCITQGLVFPVGGLFFENILSPQTHYLASMVLKSWNIVQDMQAIQIYKPQVSLQWTWFKFGKPILKQPTERLQNAKRKNVYSIL